MSICSAGLGIISKALPGGGSDMPRGASRITQGRQGFSTTRWSLVVAAGDSQNPGYAAAVAELCSVYWYPVYAFVRRRGFGPDTAQDLTQGFFAQILEKKTLGAARHERGRFRSFLLAALKFYISHERERADAQKRGGGIAPIRLDADTAEGKYRLEPSDPDTPESLFERRWAFLLLERSLKRLREETKDSAHPDRSLRLVGYLSGGTTVPEYKQAAAELGMSESAMKVAMHRLRNRFRELLRDEVMQTVIDPDKVDDELRYLVAVLGRT
jgi:RNA polymerase sigma-70 factor (ECF subfamily)